MIPQLLRPLSRELFSALQATNRLDLSKRTGQMDLRFLDLPGRSESAQMHYIRHQERPLIPSSYRTGLAFFAAVILLSVFGISALGAQTMAESHREFLYTQMLEEFSQLSAELTAFGSSPQSFELSRPDPDSAASGIVTSFDQQSRWVEMGLQVQEGYESFQGFLEAWKQTDTPVLQRLKRMNGLAHRSVDAWDRLFSHLQDFPFHQLAPEKKAELNRSLGMIAETHGLLRGFTRFEPTLEQLLGKDEPQRVVLFVMDPHEMRATGGALSTGMELLVDAGEIIHQKAFHVSELDSELEVSLPAPPELSAISNRWNLSTANSFVDASRSAEQMAWFWQREARSTADVIVMVNSSALERLLSQVSDEDFKNVSLRWSALRLNGQRQELKELTHAIFAETLGALQQPEKILQLWPEIEALHQERHIMVFGTSEQLQRELSPFGLNPSLPRLGEREDVLMVSRINAERNAIDRWIQEGVQLHTSISPEGSIKHWLRITRKNRWENAFLAPLLEKIPALPASVIRSMSTAPYQGVTRIVVPKGSELGSATGIGPEDLSIQHTDTHTVWTLKQSTNAGETSTIELIYTLPWTFDTTTVDNYRLHLLKQPGSPAVAFEHLVKIPPSLSLFQSLPEQPITEWKRDEQMAIVAGRNP